MVERIRVIQMVYSLHIESGGGGLTRAAIDVAQNLDPARFDVSIVGLGDAGTEAERQWLQQFSSKGIPAYTATVWDDNRPYQSFFRAYKVLRENFIRKPPDIIHSHSEFTDITAILLKMAGVTPLIMRSSHYGYAIEWRKRPLRRALLTNFLYPILFNIEVGTNPEMTNRMSNRMVARILRKKAVFISGAVKLDRFEDIHVNVTDKRRSLGIPEDACIIGCVGRLVEQKGVGYLLRAAQQVIRLEPRTFFLIVGEGLLETELKGLAKELGISQHVVFTGSRSDVEELLKCMDIFVLASLWEGFPNAVMEAMASSTPVITTDIPGNRDLIQDGKTGRLVPASDVGTLSAAILDLLASPQQRDKLAKNAKSSVQQYSSANIAARYAALYHRLIGKN